MLFDLLSQDKLYIVGNHCKLYNNIRTLDFYSQVKTTSVANEKLILLDFYIHFTKQRLGFGRLLMNKLMNIYNKTIEEILFCNPNLKIKSFLYKNFNVFSGNEFQGIIYKEINIIILMPIRNIIMKNKNEKDYENQMTKLLGDNKEMIDQSKPINHNQTNRNTTNNNTNFYYQTDLKNIKLNDLHHNNFENSVKFISDEDFGKKQNSYNKDFKNHKNENSNFIMKDTYIDHTSLNKNNYDIAYKYPLICNNYQDIYQSRNVNIKDELENKKNVIRKKPKVEIFNKNEYTINDKLRNNCLLYPSDYTNIKDNKHDYNKNYLKDIYYGKNQKDKIHTNSNEIDNLLVRSTCNINSFKNNYLSQSLNNNKEDELFNKYNYLNHLKVNKSNNLSYNSSNSNKYENKLLYMKNFRENTRKNMEYISNEMYEYYK